MKNVAVFDLDGVLADFEGRLHKELLKAYGTRGATDRSLYALEDRYSDDPEVLSYALQLVKDPNLYYGLEPNQNAIDLVFDFSSLGYEMWFLSSRPKAAETHTRRWIKKYVGYFNNVSCGVYDKAGFLEENVSGNVIVFDDNPEIIEQVSSAGYRAFCWAQPWNNGVYPRIWKTAAGLAARFGEEHEPFIFDIETLDVIVEKTK